MTDELVARLRSAAYTSSGQTPGLGRRRDQFTYVVGFASLEDLEAWEREVERATGRRHPRASDEYVEFLPPPFRTGDHVHHEPSGEDWVVSWADPETGDMSWVGYPTEGTARISDCSILKRCSDAEHVRMKTTLKRICHPHWRKVERLYGGVYLGDNWEDPPESVGINSVGETGDQAEA